MDLDEYQTGDEIILFINENNVVMDVHKKRRTYTRTWS